MSPKPWTSGKILIREAVFEGHLTNLEPLRIGSGEQAPLTSAVNLGVIKINIQNVEVPYIPGSSLKGCFRGSATALAHSKGLSVCSGLSKETCMDLRKADSGLALGNEIELAMRRNRSDEAMEQFFKHACVLCKIFGAPGYIGKVSFSDAYPIEEDGKITHFRVGVRPGIAIDRRTGAVAAGPYVVEYVGPGAVFKLRVTSVNLPNYALGLLASVMTLIQKGEVKVGGFKTRGFGRLSVKDLRLRFRDLERPDIMDLRPIEEGVEDEVKLADIARRENGWVVVDGENSWRALERLEEAWWNAKL